MSSYLSPVIQHNDQRIFVKGSIKEKEIDFLLDTGAEITVIPTKLAQGLNIPYKKTKLCLTGVIGEDSVLYETPPIEVQFGPKTSQVTYVTMVPRVGNETLRPLGVATGNALSVTRSEDTYVKTPPVGRRQPMTSLPACHNISAAGRIHHQLLRLKLASEAWLEA